MDERKGSTKYTKIRKRNRRRRITRVAKWVQLTCRRGRPMNASSNANCHGEARWLRWAHEASPPSARVRVVGCGRGGARGGQRGAPLSLRIHAGRRANRQRL